jgi:hypothetical protein
LEIKLLSKDTGDVNTPSSEYCEMFTTRPQGLALGNAYFCTNSVFVCYVKCFIWRITSRGAEAWALRNVDEKCLGIFEMWCWRKMEKIR